jgi:hypothetical protein
MKQALMISNFGWSRTAILAAAIAGLAALPSRSQDLTFDIPARKAPASDAKRNDVPADVLTPAEWKQVDESVQRALIFLASQQAPDGSFPTLGHAQPAVTSLCVLSFMAHGHMPGEGEFGDRLEKATNFIIGCQKRNGLIMLEGPDTAEITRDVEHLQSVAGAYNHAISSLTLAEMYGMRPEKKSSAIQAVIEKSVKASLTMQRWPKDFPYDRGGWRYIHDYDQTDSDLSVTGWELMFLRSARNAGFNVPQQTIDDAVNYVRRTFVPQYGTFDYRIRRSDTRSRGMTGAGILALGHAGFHNSKEAQSAGKELLEYSFEIYNDNQPFPTRDRYHYSLFMCCQGTYQLGNPYWEQFFPRTTKVVLRHQFPDGSWDAESFHRDRRYGNAYTTAMVILALGAPNQFLPIFQR